MAEYCVAKELESALTDKCTEDIDIDVVDIMENSKVWTYSAMSWSRNQNHLCHDDFMKLLNK